VKIATQRSPNSSLQLQEVERLSSNLDVHKIMGKIKRQPDCQVPPKSEESVQEQHSQTLHSLKGMERSLPSHSSLGDTRRELVIALADSEIGVHKGGEVGEDAPKSNLLDRRSRKA